MKPKPERLTKVLLLHAMLIRDASDILCVSQRNLRNVCVCVCFSHVCGDSKIVVRDRLI